MKAATEYRYNRLTWAEMNEAIAVQKLVMLPIASTEQHGRHLPLDTDVFLCDYGCCIVNNFYLYKNGFTFIGSIVIFCWDIF